MKLLKITTLIALTGSTSASLFGFVGQSEESAASTVDDQHRKLPVRPSSRTITRGGTRTRGITRGSNNVITRSAAIPVTPRPTAAPTPAPTNPEGNLFAHYEQGANGLWDYSYSGNPNCQELGYSFGYKMDGGCKSGVFSLTSLEGTGDFNTCDAAAGKSVDVKCSADGTTATITPLDDDAIVKMKGGNGGTIYKTLEQGKTYDLDVGVAKEISHIEFCFSCQKVTRNSVQIADTKQPACPATATGTINHEAAQSAKEVSVKVDIVNDKSHFALTITDAPYADAGKSITIPAFCVDYSRGIYGSTFDMDIISAFDKESMSAYGSDANGQEKAPVDFPDQLPNLGWLMNEINVGDTFDDMKECQGTIDWNEYQVALWYVIDDVKSDTSKIHPYYNGGNFQECVALGLAQMALEKGNGWTPDCNNAGELVPLLFIVDSDNTVGGSGSIEKQVLMGQVELASIEGMCVCETEAPTEAPTTSAPTKAPTNAPVTSKSGPEDEKMTTASPPGTKGDPHFKTHGGEMYDFHGGCDLVLLDNPDFLDGLGMLIHIRTKIETWWSYVESAAIRIGDETLVVRGGNKDEWLLTNGEANAAVEEEKWYLSKFAGLTLRYKQSRAGREVHIYMPNGEKVMIKSFHDFVKVELKADGSEYFQGSHGLLGRFPDGKRVARDGETFIEDVNAFGQEWQVLVEEPKLFGNYDDKWVVPAGQKCAMPSETLEKKQLRQRRLASGIPMEDAEKACAHLADASDHKACVFDVIATQDTNMAAVW